MEEIQVTLLRRTLRKGRSQIRRNVGDSSQRLLGEYPEVISYLADNWISCKEKICRAWTNKITHFGNATTQSGESIHNAIKRDLPYKLLHLRDVWDLLDLYITRRVTELRHKIGYQHSKIRDNHRKPLYVPLHHVISHYTLDKVEEHCGLYNLHSNYEAEFAVLRRCFHKDYGLTLRSHHPGKITS